MNTQNHQVYSERIIHFEKRLNKIIKKNRQISVLRLLIFLITAGIIIYLNHLGFYFILYTFILAIIPFLFLVKLNVKYNQSIRYLRELIKVNHNELEAIKGNISVFASGKEFIDPDHPYSFDLDIFGEDSIYQLINRTCTGGGAIKLANALKGYEINKSLIEQRQRSVRELSPFLDWRHEFQATGNIVLEQEGFELNKSGWLKTENRKYANDSMFHSEILDWLNEPFIFFNNKIIRGLLYVLPTLSIVLFALTLGGSFPFLGFALFGLVQLFLVLTYLTRINKIQDKIGRKVELLNKYERLVKLIENQQFSNEILRENKELKLLKSGNASKSLKRLKSLVKALDNRNNILFAFIANAYFSWDIQVLLRMEKWKTENRENLPLWLEAIYELDFLSSFATFSYNHPAFCYPAIKEGDFYFDMEQGGHPLIDTNTRIDNDITINGHRQLLVITGANMAGKSTFLRTIGVNLVLALAGSVVCARRLIISPIKLHTSIRTSDSVQKSESYFYAELKRLKAIIDRMQAGEKLFIIIDEMLRGTNSKDKHHGSEALIEQLIRLDGSGLLATHDIALGSLAEKYPENVKNYRFEVEIKNNELEFDYKLKTGISQNLNATFLMKKMGITV